MIATAAAIVQNLPNVVFILFLLLTNSEAPNLPVAKAIIKVILIHIPVRNVGGGLTTNNQPLII